MEVIAWSEFIRTVLQGSFKSVFQMAVIIIPLMICLEVAKDMNVLDGMAGWLAPVMRFFRLSQKGAFPLLIGLIFGLAYGAGVILESVKNGDLTWRDLFLINVFLVLCHSVLEDTALFMAVGANGMIILAGRLILAVLVTYILSRWSGINRLEKVLAGRIMVPHCSHCEKR